MFRRCVFLFSEKYVLERFSLQIYKLLYFPIFEFTGSSYVTYIAPQSENIFPFCDLSKCGLTGVFLYFGTAPVSENPPKKIPLKENLGGPGYGTDKKIKHDSNVRQDKQ